MADHRLAPESQLEKETKNSFQMMNICDLQAEIGPLISGVPEKKCATLQFSFLHV